MFSSAANVFNRLDLMFFAPLSHPHFIIKFKPPQNWHFLKRFPILLMEKFTEKLLNFVLGSDFHANFLNFQGQH